jgi:hypothetical protein
MPRQSGTARPGASSLASARLCTSRTGRRAITACENKAVGMRTPVSGWLVAPWDGHCCELHGRTRPRRCVQTVHGKKKCGWRERTARCGSVGSVLGVKKGQTGELDRTAHHSAHSTTTPRRLASSSSPHPASAPESSSSSCCSCCHGGASAPHAPPGHVHRLR